MSQLLIVDSAYSAGHTLNAVLNQLMICFTAVVAPEQAESKELLYFGLGKLASPL